MSRVTLRRCVVFIFNLSSILCLTIDRQGSLKISKLLAVKNLLTFPLLVIIRWQIPISYYVVGLKQDFTPGGVSLFFINTVTFMTITNFILFSSSVYIQWWKRKEILKFIENCIKFHQKNKLLDTQQFIVAEKKFYRSFFSMMGLIVVLMSLEFPVTTNMNWQGFVILTVSPNNGFFALFLLAFLNCFLSYFQFLISRLNLELRKQSHAIYGKSNYNKINCFTMDLHELLIGFEKAFGKLFTLAIVLIVVTNIIRVSFILILDFLAGNNLIYLSALLYRSNFQRDHSAVVENASSQFHRLHFVNFELIQIYHRSMSATVKWSEFHIDDVLFQLKFILYSCVKPST